MHPTGTFVLPPPEDFRVAFSGVLSSCLFRRTFVVPFSKYFRHVYSEGLSCCLLRRIFILPPPEDNHRGTETRSTEHVQANGEICRGNANWFHIEGSVAGKNLAA